MLLLNTNVALRYQCCFKIPINTMPKKKSRKVRKCSTNLKWKPELVILQIYETGQLLNYPISSTKKITLTIHCFEV